MVEQKISKSWETYLESVDRHNRLLFIDLLMEGRLEDFPYVSQLEEILDGMDHIRRYRSAITHYRPEIDKAQETLYKAADFINKMVEYVKKTPFKDNSRVTKDLANIIKTRKVGDEEVLVMQEYVNAAIEALEEYKPSASPIDMPKEKKGKKLKVEAKVSILILVLSLGFASLRILSVMQITTTGFSALPTGEIAGINFEMFYLVTSSMILSIYILGKLMKKW